MARLDGFPLQRCRPVSLTVRSLNRRASWVFFERGHGCGWITESQALDSQNCQNKGHSNRQGERLPAFYPLVKLPFTFLGCVCLCVGSPPPVNPSLGYKVQSPSSIALSLWAWPPSRLCYLYEPLSLESGSRVTSKKIKLLLVSALPGSDEREHPPGQLYRIKGFSHSLAVSMKGER